MRALVYTSEQTVCHLDVPEPKVGEGDVLVKVLTAGICGTDIGAVRDGRPPLKAPTTMGHEFVGRRADTGEMVVVNPLISCHRCSQCFHGPGPLQSVSQSREKM